MKSGNKNMLPLKLLYKHGYLSSSSSSSLLSSYKRSFSSSSSSLWWSASPDKYEDFFPCYHSEYLRGTIDWYHSEQLGVAVPYMQAQASFDKALAKYVRKPPLLENEPHYDYNTSYDFDFDDPIPIRKGHHFDLISLLSTYYSQHHLVRIRPNPSRSDFVRANDLRGKYVLLCCIFLPCVWSRSGLLHRLSILSSELSQTRVGSYFEIVIVPKMRKGWDDDEGVFHHSLSAFSGCLTVPFTHKSRRDYICKSLNFGGSFRSVLVNHSLEVLLDGFSPFSKYGARGFPFTEEHLTSLIGEDDWGEPCSSSNKTLAGLLSCKSNPSFLLPKFDSEETISVQQLNKHLVGLYLFRTGDSLKSFHTLYQECRNQGLDFEIVLVCLPFGKGVNPKDFQHVVLSALKKNRVPNWWVFPFNNSACCRLNNLSSSSTHDSMIIVGPHNKFVDRQGQELVSIYGFHLGTQMYPFTMEALLQVFVQRLETISVESLLGCHYVYRDYKCDDSKRMPLSELKGNNFFVFLASPETIEPPLMYECLDLAEWYDIIKEKDPSFQVIFVPVTLKQYPQPCSKIRKVISKSWTKFLICPFDDPKHPQRIWNHDAFLLSCGVAGLPVKGLPIPSVLAFGKDGHLQTLDAHRFLTNHGLDAYPSLFDSRNRNLNLCNDIAHQLCEEYRHLREDSTLSL